MNASKSEKVLYETKTMYREKKIFAKNKVKESKEWLRWKEAEKMQGHVDGIKQLFWKWWGLLNKVPRRTNEIKIKVIKLFGMKLKWDAGNICLKY